MPKVVTQICWIILLFTGAAAFMQPKEQTRALTHKQLPGRVYLAEMNYTFSEEFEPVTMIELAQSTERWDKTIRSTISGTTEEETSPAHPHHNKPVFQEYVATYEIYLFSLNLRL